MFADIDIGKCRMQNFFQEQQCGERRIPFPSRQAS
jgi:hypothetical protein